MGIKSNRYWKGIKKGKLWLIPLLIISESDLPRRLLRSRRKSEDRETKKQFENQMQINRKNRNEGGDIYPMW